MPRLAALTLAALLALCTAHAGAEPKEERPKLAIVKLDSPPATAQVGDSFDVAGRVANRGERTGRGRVRVFLGEVKLDAPKIKLGAGRRALFEAEVQVPQLPVTGTYEEGLELEACIRKHGTRGRRRCRTADGALRIVGAGPADTPTFSAGARTAGDPVFPQVGNGGYQVDHYDLVLHYDPATNAFGPGTETNIQATATQNLAEFSLDFQDLGVSDVLVNGAPAAFNQVPASPPLVGAPGTTQLRKLVVTPATGVPAGQPFTVEVRYAGAVPVMVDADGSKEGWIPACHSTGVDCDGAFVVNEPNGAQTFMPSNNHPSDKATIDSHLTVPTTHVAFGAGELAGGAPVDNGDGTSTWNWSEDDPTATYLTTATVGLFDYATQNMTETSTGRTLAIHRAFDSSASLAQENQINGSFDLIDTQMNQLSEWYGPYPFDSTGGIADRTTGVGYALEVQTKPHYATLSVSESTQLHELAHQWFGDAISPATWRELWFNEGWAVFSTWYSPGGPAGEASAQAQFLSFYNNPSTNWSLAPRAVTPVTLFNTTAVYNRPAAAIEGYREIVGDTKFFALVEALFDGYGYGVIDYQQFVDETVAASEFTGAEADKLRDYWGQWLNGTIKPAIHPGNF